MSFQIEPVPQRETLADKKRDRILKRLAAEEREFLPPMPCTAIIYGAIGSGKSSLLYSWLKNLFPNYYDECVIFCGSADSKEAFESVPQKRVVFLTDYDDEAFTDYINKLKEHQLERMEAGKAPLNIFIGMDDIVFSQSISSKGKPSMAERLMLICRHELNASVIICVQHSKQVNPAMRNNTLLHVLTRLQRNDLQKVAEAHCNHMTEREFMDMYYDIMKEPYQFLVVDYKANPSKRFRHGWTRIYNKGRDEATPLQALAQDRPDV
jgi:Poxvirus A32 protein